MVQRAQIEANLNWRKLPSWTSVSTSEIWWTGGTICGLQEFYPIWETLLCALVLLLLLSVCCLLVLTWSFSCPTAPVCSEAWSFCKGPLGWERVKGKEMVPINQSLFKFALLCSFLDPVNLKRTSQRENRRRGTWSNIFILPIMKRLWSWETLTEV